MKARTKLIMSIMSICLVCAVFAIGVFALKTANLKIGGDVSFSATGVEADIKNITLTGATTNDQVLATGSINTSMTQADIDTTFQNWQSLKLDFNENADDITLKFNIANTSTNADNYIEIDYDYSFTTENPNVDIFAGEKNAEDVWVNNKYILAPKGSAEGAIATYETFTLKFRVLDKELNVPKDTSVNVIISLSYISPVELDEDCYYQDIEYTLTEGTPNVASVTTYRNEPTNVIIPEVVKYEDSCYIVSSFEDIAFLSCSELESITIPNSVCSLGGGLFEMCESLGPNITIPRSVSYIGTGMLIGTDISKINIESGNVAYDGRFNCNAIVETATNVFLVGCKNSYIPEGIVGIADFAFSDCYGLTEITLPSTIKSIGDNAFASCYYVKEINIPYGVLTIGESAFFDSNPCDTIPETVISVGDSAFHCEYIKIDSQSVVNGLTYKNAVIDDGASDFELKIYIKSNLDVSAATYLTNTENFTPEKVGDVVCDADGDGYILYTKVIA